MAYDSSIRQEILNKTVQEAALKDEDGSASPCVICLDTITEAAVAIPCKHANFDFLCLASWLQQRRICPLCKTELTAVEYDLQATGGPKLYTLQPDLGNQAPSSDAHPARADHIPSLHRHRPRRRPVHHRPLSTPDADNAIERRCYIYRKQLFSLRVGSNRLSQYRELTPQLFNRDENLISRARKWIRRELQVFEFLNPDKIGESTENSLHERTRPGQQRLESRRANNAEFLLEYIIAILRTVDVKGSTGQAEDLLQEFIGRANARLFLHELNSWLRSPYNLLQDWDRHVQYHEHSSRNQSIFLRDEVTDSRSVSTTRVESGRVVKPQSFREAVRRDDPAALLRRVQRARQRYQPD